jgi:hypothetical protein
LRYPLVVRIRESPLEALRFEDVVVPQRAKPGLCAWLTVLHLTHLLPLSGWQHDQAIPFLRAGGEVSERLISCFECVRQWSFVS